MKYKQSLKFSLRSNYKNILVTGGAGFIGSFLVDLLVEEGYKVRIFDNLEEQVHFGEKPAYLNKNAEFIKGDVRNNSDLKKAIDGIDAIFHLASAVGVGQSNYQIKKYVDSNILGTANLLDLLINTKNNIKKFITISSMTGYGEGNYLCKKCGIVRPPLREEGQLKKKDWNLYCPICGQVVEPKPTDENALDYPNSIYGFTKKAQQDMALIIGKLYNLPTVVLRGFNIYGPRQSLSNPYTGVTAIFISRLKNNQFAIVYEDGLQTRDFVSVHDVAKAFVLALVSGDANYQMFNIGSGKGTTILEVSQTLSKLLGKSGLIQVNQEFRKNDIRHCYADISKAKRILGWEPKVSLEQGLKELIEWGATQKAEDRFSQAQKELKQKGLI
ncbi:SDR family NAD(P)-dependent oxidoreductase [Patescibacteria group bacterium]|nr:SDR family NAD(P)-dependent oxidoreductase [Patescibacteria group bacterium]